MSYPMEVLIKTVAAVVLGGIVGWQRETRDRPAGLRTHVLVCVGASVYTLASLGFPEARSDPARIAAQVATGMGFLGAGTIIRHGSVVRGLTTAASLWAVAGIGICVGLGGRAFWAAGTATMAVMLTLTVLREVEQRLLPRSRTAHLTLRLPQARTQLADLEARVAGAGARLDGVRISEPRPDGTEEVEIFLRLPQGADFDALCQELGAVPGFVSVTHED